MKKLILYKYVQSFLIVCSTCDIGALRLLRTNEKKPNPSVRSTVEKSTTNNEKQPTGGAASGKYYQESGNFGAGKVARITPNRTKSHTKYTFFWPKSLRNVQLKNCVFAEEMIHVKASNAL